MRVVFQWVLLVSGLVFAFPTTARAADLDALLKGAEAMEYGDLRIHALQTIVLGLPEQSSLSPQQALTILKLIPSKTDARENSTRLLQDLFPATFPPALRKEKRIFVNDGFATFLLVLAKSKHFSSMQSVSDEFHRIVASAPKLGLNISTDNEPVFRSWSAITTLQLFAEKFPQEVGDREPHPALGKQIYEIVLAGGIPQPTTATTTSSNDGCLVILVSFGVAGMAALTQIASLLISFGG